VEYEEVMRFCILATPLQHAVLANEFSVHPVPRAARWPEITAA
jgi:hypothetical protein